MNKLTTELRAQVIRGLVEGNSIRATVRMTGVAKNTVVKLLVDVGRTCADYQDKHLRNLSCKRLQCDEIWSFCYAKAKNVPANKQGVFGYGDVRTWTAMCADTKLIPCWLVGRRSATHANKLMEDLASRLNSRVQLRTDGHAAYLDAVERAFGSEIDYAMLVKLYGDDPKDTTRYSQPKCNGAIATTVKGQPKRKHISMSYVERQNLKMQMSMRRFTRLTNAFSKKVDNHYYSIALHFMYYNFCRIHQTLRVTPATAAGVTDRVWDVEDIIGLLDSN